MGIPWSTVFAIIKRHRDNPRGVVDKPRSGQVGRGTQQREMIVSSAVLFEIDELPLRVSCGEVELHPTSSPSGQCVGVWTHIATRRGGPSRNHVFMMHTRRCVRTKKHLIVKVHNFEMINICYICQSSFYINFFIKIILLFPWSCYLGRVVPNL